jgi:hypothetical protein
MRLLPFVQASSDCFWTALRPSPYVNRRLFPRALPKTIVQRLSVRKWGGIVVFFHAGFDPGFQVRQGCELVFKGQRPLSPTGFLK